MNHRCLRYDLRGGRLFDEAFRKRHPIWPCGALPLPREEFPAPRGSIFRCGTRAPRPRSSRGRRSLIVIETFRLLPYDPAADETLERTQRRLIFRRNKADRITYGVRAAGTADAMDIIL